MSPPRRFPTTGGWALAVRAARTSLLCLPPLRAASGFGHHRPRFDLPTRRNERTAAAVASEHAACEREQESRQRLTELDRHKTEFISSISHELRTPLTSISGYLELLMDGEAGMLTEPQRHMLSIIDRNSRRLLVLLDGLITLSRLEAGTFSVRMDAVDVRLLVSSVLRSAEPMLADRSLRLDTEVAADIGVLRGDAVELERALENVMTNAMKFTEPGGLIRLSARSTAEHVVLTVEDTGSGILDADREKLFTRFFRAGAAHEQAIPGTGLGLVIVKGILDCHRGEVSIASTPGCGTTVTITLPRNQPDNEGSLPPAIPVPAVGRGALAARGGP